jgi:RNA polymerase sigma-70 factor, ECF subfamily
LAFGLSGHCKDLGGAENLAKALILEEGKSFVVAVVDLGQHQRPARTSSDGDLILLEQQDRSLWNRDQIAEGISLTESALRSRRFGAYTLQAAIAAVHAESPSVASTDWRQITPLYDQLLRVQPSPVVELNRVVAVAMCEGLEQGLALIDDLLAREHLSQYHLAHSARADMCRRLGRIPEARALYEEALTLAPQASDRRFLARRLAELK